MVREGEEGEGSGESKDMGGACLIWRCSVVLCDHDLCLNTGVMVAVVFVSNLIKRHPNCSVLLHRKNAQGTTYMYTHMT